MNLGGKQNLSGQNANQPLEVGGFKITFRTMPQDMEALGLSMETILQPKESLAKPISPPAQTKSARAKELYREAKSLYGRKFYQAAVEKLEELINLQRGSISARWLLYRARKKLGKLQPLRSQEQKPEKPSAEDYEALATAQRKEREQVEKAGYLPTIAPQLAIRPPAQIQETEKSAREKLLAQIQQEEREKVQLQEKLLQETREREMAEQKLAEARERQRLEAARIQEEREQALLQEKLLRETKERELMEQKIAEETERQKQLEQQAMEVATARPAPAFQPPPISKPEEGVVSLTKKRWLPPISAKTIEVAGAIIIILAVSSGLVYWIGWQKLHPSAPSAEQPSAQSETVLPAPLFPIDETLSLSLQIGRKKTLFHELEKISERNQASGTFARVLVKFVSEDGTQSYASLGDLIDALQIVFPSEILNSLDKNNYTLFLYAQKNLSSSPFAISMGRNKIGIIVAVAKKDNVAQKFLSWEKTMPQDLDALFLGKKISFPTQYQFEDIPYREVLIRAFDMPDQFSSLNYTFPDNKIIIATSLETTESLIDKLAPRR
jgi:hypothetical protein